MRILALREKKFDMMAAEMKSAPNASNLDVFAEQLQLNPEQALEIRFNMLNLPGAGPEPKIIGAAFALQPNTVSPPLKGNAGAFLVEVVNQEDAIEPDDFSALSRQLKNAFINRVINDAFNAIRNSAKIEDNRHMFF